MKSRKLIKLDLLRRKINEHFTANPKSKSAIFKVESDQSKTHWKVTRKKSNFNIVEVKSERSEFIIEQPIGQQYRQQAAVQPPMPVAAPPLPMAPMPMPPAPGAPMAPVTAAPPPPMPPMGMPPMGMPPMPPPPMMAPPPPAPMPPPMPVAAPPPPPAEPALPPPPAPAAEPTEPLADPEAGAKDLANLPPVSGNPNDWDPQRPQGRFGAEVYQHGQRAAQQRMPPDELQQHFGIAHSKLKGGAGPTGDPLANPAIDPGDVKLDHNGMPQAPIQESSPAYMDINQEFATLFQTLPVNQSKINALQQKIMQNMPNFVGGPEMKQVQHYMQWLDQLGAAQTGGSTSSSFSATGTSTGLSAVNSHKRGKGKVLEEQEEEMPFQPSIAEEVALVRSLKGQTIKDVSVVNDEDMVKIELNLVSTKWPASFEMDKEGKLVFTFKDRRYTLHKKWS